MIHQPVEEVKVMELVGKGRLEEDVRREGCEKNNQILDRLLRNLEGRRSQFLHAG